MGYENCPMTVIEAFSFGVPVIAPDHSGFIELITNDKTGYLLDFESDNDYLIKRIKEINKIKNQNMKNNILEFYNKKLTKKRHINQILDIYNN